MKQKVLLTGSNGFIGQKIMDQILQDKDIDLLAFSRGKNRYTHAHGYTYLEGDVCDEDQLREVVLQYRPDFIIHTVAMANVEACEKDAKACFKVNVEPVRVFIELANRHDFQFIYLSSDFVFDGKNGPYAEEDSTHPLNVYGESKAAAERLLQASSIRWTIVRTILVYGLPHEPQRSNLILWVKRSLEENKAIKVVTDHYRMPTLVEDLAKAIGLIIEKQATGIYHISGEEGNSIYEIALMVADFWKLDASLIEPVVARSLNTAVPRPHYTGFVLEKAKLELGFNPSNLNAGLRLVQQYL